MKTRSTFQKALDHIGEKIRALQEQAGVIRSFCEQGCMTEAYESALRLEETSEKAVLLTRALPAYTGNPKARLEVENLIKLSIPVEIGFTEGNWFSLRFPALLPKKDSGSVDYILKALVLYIDSDRTRSPGEKHLPAVYQLLTQHTERQLTALFEKLPLDRPARAPYNLFAQSSDTVRSGIILGLGTRLQVLQNRAVKEITSWSDIDLTAPAKRKCAYYIILSDQDATMAFLSSLFFSFLFIKLTRYADSRPNGRCDVPVNLILDEFNNVGRIGGAADGSDFARSLSVIRSRDIRVMIAVQSLGQLQNRYPNNLWAEIIGNADIQLMLGCTDDVTAKYFSERSGDMSIQINSTMTVRQTMAVAQVIPQYRQTEGQGRRKLLTPDEVLRLPNEELLCIIRGCNILKLKKLDYTKHPAAKQIKRVSIMDYTPDKTNVYQTEAVTAANTLPDIDMHLEEFERPPKRKPLYSSAQPPDDF